MQELRRSNTIPDEAEAALSDAPSGSTMPTTSTGLAAAGPIDRVSLRFCFRSTGLTTLPSAFRGSSFIVTTAFGTL